MYDQEELKNIPGIKIRRQCLRKTLYIAAIGTMFLTIFYLLELSAREDFNPLPILMLILALLPSVLLNRFLLGRIVCVINEDGIYYYHGLIEWKEIERVEYDIESKGGYVPTVTSIYVMGKKGKPQIVYNVPYFALRKIKKFKPDVELAFTDRGKRFLFWDIIFAIILGLVLPFVLFFK